MNLGTQFAVLNEGVEMLAKDLGGFHQGQFGMNTPVGVDLHGQFVVVRFLSNACGFDVVTDTDHGAEDGVDGNDANFLFPFGMFRRWHVPAAVFHDHLHDEFIIAGQRGQHVFLVDHLDVAIGLDIRAGHGPCHVFFHANDFRRLTVVLDDQGFDIQHDIGDIFHDTFDGREFVLSPLDAQLRDGAAFQAGQQDPPQRIADRHPKSTLERFDHELSVGIAEGPGNTANLIRKFQSAPTYMHSFPRCLLL